MSKSSEAWASESETPPPASTCTAAGESVGGRATDTAGAEVRAEVGHEAAGAVATTKVMMGDKRDNNQSQKDLYRQYNKDHVPDLIEDAIAAEFAANSQAAADGTD